MHTILIVEDHEDMQTMYKVIFRKLHDIHIVDMLDTAEKAFDAVEKNKPELMIIDISLPGMNGIDLTKKIKEKYPCIKVLIASAHDPEVYYKPAKMAGADDFTKKDNAREICEKTCRLLGS